MRYAHTHVHELVFRDKHARTDMNWTRKDRTQGETRRHIRKKQVRHNAMSIARRTVNRPTQYQSPKDVSIVCLIADQNFPVKNARHQASEILKCPRIAKLQNQCPFSVCLWGNTFGFRVSESCNCLAEMIPHEEWISTAIKSQIIAG